MFNPLICEKCGRELESDDAISIIDGICAVCRQMTESLAQPLRADQLIAQSALEKQEIPQCEPGFYQESPLQDRPADDEWAIASPEIAASDAPPSETHESLPSPVRKETDSVLSIMDPASESDRLIPPDQPSRSSRVQPIIHPPRPPFDTIPTIRIRRRRRDLTIGILTGLLLTVGVTGYFLRGRAGRNTPILSPRQNTVSQFSLVISPASAAVKLDGEALKPPDANGRLIFSVPGDRLDDHWLEIAAEGYVSIRQPLSNYQGAPEAFITLMHQPYELSVRTTPRQAEVWLNDEMLGTSPLTTQVNPSHPLQMVIRHPGFADVIKILQPPKIGNRLAITLDLIAKGPVLQIETDPSNTKVSIDGQIKGRSPLTLELDPSYLGKTVEITASSAGYDDTHQQVSMPSVVQNDAVSMRLKLVPSKPRFVIQTQPPGGRVVIAGRDYGTAPVTAAFNPTQSGQTTVIEAAKDGRYFGQDSYIIPPVGKPVSITLSMAFSAQRVVFILGCPQSSGKTHYRLTDRLTRHIQRLRPTQRFTILAATETGMDTWPGPQDYKSASSEQKIRAYDMVGMVRPTRHIDVDALLRASVAMKPTAIWLYLECALDPAILEQFDTETQIHPISMNIVRASAGPTDLFLKRWTTRHHGTLTFPIANTSSTLAMDPDSDP